MGPIRQEPGVHDVCFRFLTYFLAEKPSCSDDVDPGSYYPRRPNFDTLAGPAKPMAKCAHTPLVMGLLDSRLSNLSLGLFATVLLYR